MALPVDALKALSLGISGGRCHTIAMSWVHHLSADARVAMSNLTMPLLPQMGVEVPQGGYASIGDMPQIGIATDGWARLTRHATCRVVCEPLRCGLIPPCVKEHTASLKAARVSEVLHGDACGNGPLPPSCPRGPFPLSYPVSAEALCHHTRPCILVSSCRCAARTSPLLCWATSPRR